MASSADEPALSGDHIRVAVYGYSGRNGGVTKCYIDLEEGKTLKRHGKGWRRFPLDEEVVARMREAAIELQGKGDQTIRLSQFVLGEIQYRTTLGGKVSTVTIQDEGGGMPEPYHSVWEVALRVKA